MLRIVVCSAALIAVMAGVRLILKDALDQWGLSWGALFVCGWLAAMCVIAWLYDRAKTRRQEVLPPEPRDFR